MFMVMYLAAAEGFGFSLPYEAVAAFGGSSCFVCGGVEGFCGGLRRRCRSSCRVKPKWGVRWGFAVG
jgi:hypothetical protein